MSGNTVLASFLLGAALALLGAKFTPLGDYLTEDYPPGPKPTEIQCGGAVVTVKVSVRSESAKRFTDDPLNRFYVVDSKFFKEDLKLPLTKEHVKLLNDALDLGGSREIPLPFTLPKSTSFVAGDKVHVQTVLHYGADILVDGGFLTVLGH